MLPGAKVKKLKRNEMFEHKIGFRRHSYSILKFNFSPIFPFDLFLLLERDFVFCEEQTNWTSFIHLLRPRNNSARTSKLVNYNYKSFQPISFIWGWDCFYNHLLLVLYLQVQLLNCSKLLTWKMWVYKFTSARRTGNLIHLDCLSIIQMATWLSPLGPNHKW